MLQKAAIPEYRRYTDRMKTVMSFEMLKRARDLLQANQYTPPPFVTYEEFMSICKHGERIDKTIMRALERKSV